MGKLWKNRKKIIEKKIFESISGKFFAKPYLYNLKENMKLAVKCVMVLMNDKSLGKAGMYDKKMFPGDTRQDGRSHDIYLSESSVG